MGKRFSIEYVKQRVREISDCELLEDTYKDNRTVMRFRCRCGEVFETSLNKFQSDNRRQCTNCAKTKQYNEKRLSMDDLKDRIASFGCEYLSGEYVNQKSKIHIRCACGHERDIVVNNLIYATGKYPFSGLCVKCSHERTTASQRYTITEISVLAKAFGLELLSDEYISNRSPLRFRCSCGREFTARWDNVAQGGQTRCWSCSKKVSKGEFAIASWLDEHGIDYIPQKRFLDCGGRRPYPFDFYLPDHGLCIEFDGEQHTRAEAFMGGDESFSERKAHDEAKDAYCARNGLTLLRISHTDFNRIDEILDSMVIPR